LPSRDASGLSHGSRRTTSGRFMLKDFSPQAFTMGLLAAFVGFASSFAVILQGLTAVGASPPEAASGLAALSVAMGVLGIILSVWTRMPVSVAWSTPGAALLVGTGAVVGGFGVAVGAFLAANLLIVVAGLVRPVGNAVTKIPQAVASAMLAGVLMELCFAPVKAVVADPYAGLLIFAAWAIAGAWNRLMAVPAALAAFALITLVNFPADAFSSLPAASLPFQWVMPGFSWQSMISVAVPLFFVTMASQNIPGITVLKVNGFEPPPGPLLAGTGIFSILSAPFGGHGVCLAAITASMCAGPDAHSDARRRYWSAIIAGIFYVLFGLFTGFITWFVAQAQPILIEAVAGLALFGAFSASASAAFKDPDTREAAAVTFMVTASGQSFAGVSGAFWGLLAGVAVFLLKKLIHPKA
jgi:benzoate membrane transport protein